MVSLENIIAAYHVARANKRRSPDSVEYELHLERNLLKLVNDIDSRTLAPTAYAFVTLKPRPREVFACEMGMRVIHHYIDIRLRPLIEKRLTSRTFNNRIGFGQDAAINRLMEDISEVSEGYTNDAWIIKLNLRGYFPNADLSIVHKQLSEIVLQEYEGEDKEDLLYMIERSVYSFPAKHCYRKSGLEMWGYIPDDKSLFKKPDGFGGAIGHLIWQNAMNYYLNDFDHYVIDVLGLHYIRYVDDMVFVVRNKDAFLPWIKTFRKMLKEQYHCELHSKKFYCQHYTKGVEFIGSYIKGNRVYTGKRTVCKAFEAVKVMNQYAKGSKAEGFAASINSYLGILKNRTNYGIIRDLIDSINPAWWKFVRYDDSRRCINCVGDYSHKAIMAKKYNLKYKMI